MRFTEKKIMAQKESGAVEGSRAPGFKLPADDGSIVSLGNLLGKTVVLYFYPKDDTAGCTREAIEFTAAAKSFAKAGTVILGVSKDNAVKHRKFKEKHGIGVTLLSDEHGQTIETYGAWIEKSLYGRKYMGIDRSTFLIDRSGKIAKTWRKVKVPGHVEEVLAAAKSLGPAE